MIGPVFVGNDDYKFEAELLEFTQGKVINGYEAVIRQDCIPVLIKDQITIGWFFMAVLLSVHDDLKVAEFGADIIDRAATAVHEFPALCYQLSGLLPVSNSG